MNKDMNRWQLAVGFIGIPLLYSLVQHYRKTKPKISGKGVYSVVVDMTPTASLDEKLQIPVAAQWNNLGLQKPLVIAMVGLPARGKSYLVKMLQRYLNWTGYECEVFNVGKYRRTIGLAGADASFFASDNQDAGKVREDMAMKVQNMMYDWLRESVRQYSDATMMSGHGSPTRPRSESLNDKKKVAIFDATNTTKSRRLKLIKRAEKEGVSLLFLESICDDQEVLEANYALKLRNEDYKEMDPAQAKEDFMARVMAYEQAYETIEDDENEGLS